MDRRHRNIKTDEIIATAKEKAKAALNETNPKLTALERAFYEVYKKQQL
jgi:hypothetical protein